VRGQLATVPLLAPQDSFVPALAAHPAKHLIPENLGILKGSVFNLEAVTAKKSGEEGNL
jgi:hypothetical protein